MKTTLVASLLVLFAFLAPPAIGVDGESDKGSAAKSSSEKSTAQKTPAKKESAKNRPSKPKKDKALSDAQIKRILIGESIASYSGNCPCPYNTASNGSSCGGRSAWSRAGGEEPLCYPKDVSADMVRQYRDEHKGDEVATE